MEWLNFGVFECNGEMLSCRQPIMLLISLALDSQVHFSAFEGTNVKYA